MPKISNMLIRKDLTPFQSGITKKTATLKAGVININNLHLNRSIMADSVDENSFSNFSRRFIDPVLDSGAKSP